MGKYYIGVDLGGTNLAAGLVDTDGLLVYKKSVPSRHSMGFETLARDMAALCLELVSDRTLKNEEIIGVGIGAPGVIDPIKGEVIYANNLNLHNANIVEELGKYLPWNVFVENDANCAALGENVAGGAKGAGFSITITLGTGVGSGIIVDGKIYQSNFLGSGEFGHTVVMMNGEPCSCGRKGCFEAYAAAPALMRDAKRAVAANPDSKILTLVDGKANDITPKTVFDAAQAGDSTAQELVDSYTEYLAEGFVNLVNIFQPDVIVVGGGVSAQGEKLLSVVREKMIKKCYGGVLHTQINPAVLGNDAGIIGAAMLAR